MNTQTARQPVAFGLEVLQAISDWQRGGNPRTARKRGLALKRACASLPNRFRFVPSVCFRQVALGKKSVWDLLGETRLPEKISSWTFDLKIAKHFKGGVPPLGQGFQGVIFERYPSPGEVIVNLWALYSDSDFQKAMATYRDQIRSFGAGMGQYQNSQAEIVLEVDHLIEQDIHSMGGHSSSFDELVTVAAHQIYRRTPTANEVDKLRKQVGELQSEAGAHWLDRDSTHRVLGRMQKPLKALRHIKQVQQQRN